jgi:hypothetical protein
MQVANERIMTSSVYDKIGQGYLRYRKPDPRITQSIVDLLAVPRGSVIADIGAGNYSRAFARTFALNFPKLQQAGKIGGLILVAHIRGCVSAANPFHMYLIYNHMVAAEFTWGYAGEKGAIKKDVFAINMAKTMVHQMRSLFRPISNTPKKSISPCIVSSGKN